MKRPFLVAGACIFSLTLNAAFAQQSKPAQTATPIQTAHPVAGKVPLGWTVIETATIVHGWSVKKRILGKSVRNDKKENLGHIDDVIISPTHAASFAIIGVGGFLGIAERQIAIPIHELKWVNGQIELPGATKEALKELPPFYYSH